jgi:hypothetical protein
MHQNTFLTSPDVKKYLLFGLDPGGLEMHENAFLTTYTLKNIFSKDLILVAWKCIKHVFNHLDVGKYLF